MPSETSRKPLFFAVPVFLLFLCCRNFVDSRQLSVPRIIVDSDAVSQERTKIAEARVPLLLISNGTSKTANAKSSASELIRAQPIRQELQSNNRAGTPRANSNGNLYYYIGGGIAFFLLIILITLICCCCCSSRMKSRREAQTALRTISENQQASISAESENLPSAEIQEISTFSQEPCDQPLDFVSECGVASSPREKQYQIVQAEVYSEGNDSLERYADTKIKPTTEAHFSQDILDSLRRAQLFVRQYDSAEYNSKNPRQNLSLERNNSLMHKERARRIHLADRRHSLEALDLERDSQRYNIYNFAEKKLRPTNKMQQVGKNTLSESENRRNSQTHQSHDQEREVILEVSESYKHNNHSSISPYSEKNSIGYKNKPEAARPKATQNIIEIEQKLHSLESAMSTIETNLSIIKDLTRNIEHDIVTEPLRSENIYKEDRSTTNMAPSPQDVFRAEETPYKSVQKHSSKRNLKDTPTIKDKTYYDPYSRDVRHELRDVVESKITQKHESDYNKDKNQKRIETERTEQAAENSNPKSEKENRESKFESSSQSSEEIPIPDPDYLTKSRENLSSGVAIESSEIIKPKVLPKPVIKPREFKGPYGLEDLDDMNNPLTIALRSRNRRPVLDQNEKYDNKQRY